ncbi:MAG: class I SAM-dependent methyltransferase [Patescibacteria group bacterium]|jgi:ubiquinone/menaquinone biosynthesis C-methylase UbiE
MIFQNKYWERRVLNKRRQPFNEVVRCYVFPKICQILKVIPINKNTQLLDVGCGNGFYSYYFNEICDVTGIDYSHELIRQNPIKKTILMDANDIRFADDSFDITFCGALLHHVLNEKRVINEMKRVSKEYVIIIEPNRNNPFLFLFSLFVKEENKALRYSMKYLKKMVKDCDLKIISTFSHGLIVPNKTPRILLPILKYFEIKYPLGMMNILICKK